MATEKDMMRIKSGVTQHLGRWYAIAQVWHKGDLEGTPDEVMMGPTGGLDTQEQATVYYKTKVKPAMDQVIENARRSDITWKHNETIH